MADAEFRQAIDAAAKMPSDSGAAAIRYICLFRAPKRVLTPARATKLLREITAMILDGIAFDRQFIKAPSHVWADAMSEMASNPELRRPIANHHYLLRIVQGKLGQQADHSQTERVATRRNHETTRDRGSSMQPIGEALKPALPELPENEREQRMAAAEALLLAEGFKPAFMGQHLIEQKAREIFNAESQQ